MQNVPKHADFSKSGTDRGRRHCPAGRRVPTGSAKARAASPSHGLSGGRCTRACVQKWADTTTPHGRLMLTVLGGLAEFERELIKSRTSEGRARAKAAGGRPAKLKPHRRREGRDAGEALTDIARTFGVSHTTIGRLTSAAPTARIIQCPSSLVKDLAPGSSTLAQLQIEVGAP
jgi:Resolvase, N terminal domain